MTQTILRPNAEGTYSEFPILYPQTILYYYVNGINDVRNWLKTGNPPYLDAIDGVNKIYTKSHLSKVGDFSFEDSLETSGILKVYLQLYSYQEGDAELVYVYLKYDETGWHNVGAIVPFIEYDWGENDVSLSLDSWAKINACEMYLVYYSGGKADYVHVDCARLKVEASIHYDKVNEAEEDEDSSYIRTSTSTNYWYKDTFNLPSFSLPPGDVINWVRVYCRVRSEDPVMKAYCKTMVRTHSSDYFGSQYQPEASYENIFTEYINNPNTGQPWTEVEINALEAGLQGWSNTFYGMYYPLRCTQVWIVVDHSPAPVRTPFAGDGLVGGSVG